MAMIRRIFFALTWLLVAAFAGAGTSHATPTVTAGSDTVHVGDVFTIPVSIANVTATTSGLTSFHFNLAFDPTIITALSFTDIGTDFETAANNGGGFLTGITGFVDNTTGLLSVFADWIHLGTGRISAGVLVDINFRAVAIGISPLTLSDAFLTDDGI